MLDSRWEQLADILVNYSTSTGPGERVLITMMETDTWPLARAVRGGHALPRAVWGTTRAGDWRRWARRVCATVWGDSRDTTAPNNSHSGACQKQCRDPTMRRRRISQKGTSQTSPTCRRTNGRRCRCAWRPPPVAAPTRARHWPLRSRASRAAARWRF